MIDNFFGRIFLFAVIFVLFEVYQSFSKKQNYHNLSTPLVNIQISDYPQFAPAYGKVFGQVDPDLQLAAIENALAVADLVFVGEKTELEKQAISQLHQIAASIYKEKWHFHYAINSLQKSQNTLFSNKVDIQLKRLREHLSLNDSERHLYQEYVATRLSGPAKTLQGKILVAYVFVDNGVNTRWTDRFIQQSNRVMKTVQDWKIKQAQAYNIESVNFVNKQFLVKRNPKLKMYASLTSKSGENMIEGFVSLVMEHLGAENVGDFIEREMKKVGADQGVVILHSNLDNRSFAQRCGYTHIRTTYENGVKKVENISLCTDEYAMVNSEVKQNRWDKLHYTQAHEILHLFGADDLYNISCAKEFALIDIMNHQSKNLRDSEISNITAYAIGWQDKQPVAPFKILER